MPNYVYLNSIHEPVPPRAGSFPKQRLVIQPRVYYITVKSGSYRGTTKYRTWLARCAGTSSIQIISGTKCTDFEHKFFNVCGFKELLEHEQSNSRKITKFTVCCSPRIITMISQLCAINWLELKHASVEYKNVMQHYQDTKRRGRWRFRWSLIALITGRNMQIQCNIQEQTAIS